MNDPTDHIRSPRRRGRPPRVDREAILRAARTLDPRSLTMKAVAETMGVDPKTLNYHVRDRDGLLQMIAADAFQTSYAGTDFAGNLDWQDSLRVVAVAIRDGVIATGALAVHFRFEDEADLHTLAPLESTLTRLLEAGFDFVSGARAVGLAIQLGDSYGRRAIEEAGAETPQSRQLRKMLGSDAGASLANLRELAARETPGGLEDEFDFSLRVMILGLEAVLADIS